MKKKLKNAVGTLFLVLAIAATQIPVSDVEAVTSSASDFQISGDTLVKYVGESTSVSVPENVKKIGPGAFQNDTDLYAVYLPEGLTTIENGAFSNCSVLSVVDFPDSLKKIGNFAFSNCKTLSDVTIGENVSELGYGVFAGCEALKDVKIDSDNPAFVDEAGVLYNKSKSKIIQALAGSSFTKYNMPASVEEIAPYAFWGCDDLRFVELSGSLNNIPGYAFSNCSGLEKITVPVSVHSIGSKAFADCVNLEEAVIPSSVTTIQDTAFDGCPKLTIQAEAGSYAEEFDKSRDKSNVSSAEYQDVMDRVDQTAVEEVLPEAAVETAVTEPVETPVTEPVETEHNITEQNITGQELGSTSIVGGRAVLFIDNRMENVYGSAAQSTQPLQAAEQGKTAQNPSVKDAFPEGEKAEQTVSDSGEDKEAAETVEESVSGNTAADDKKGGSFPKYTIAGDKVAAQAYYQDDSLKSYDFPAEVTQIGDFAFARSGLSEITIPEQIKTIGYGAFYHCDELKDVTIPSSVTVIEPYAFEKTAWLENWKNGGSVEDFKIVGDGILIAYKGTDGKITIPEGVKQIAAGVFADHKGITDVSLPNTLKVIGEEAFAGCSNLKSVSGGVAVTDIKDRAFAGCPISTVRIPESVERIGLGAYDQSTCSTSEDVNAVVFLGNNLPELSYEKTAQRLSNEKYRNDAFRGIEVAVVGSGMTDFEGTILDTDSYGFHGTIASLVQESQGGAAGVLHAVVATTNSVDAAGKVPASVSIYNKPYGFENADAVTVDSAERGAEAESPEEAVFVRTDGNGLAGHVSAVLKGHNECYLLDVTESSAAKEQVLTAYRTLYGQDAEPDMAGYDITLYDESGQIPVTKLGKEHVQITMPVPEGMDTNALHVVCTDEDGQLEEVEAQIDEQKGKTVVTFEAEHFSPYAIYHYENGQGAVVLKRDGGVLTSLTRKKDASPDTGDPIHPKWFLATGLFALSMMTFFLKGNRKKTPGIM